MNEKLSDWASIAPIVSSAALVVMLIFLVIEIRGNTDAIQAQTISVQREGERARRMILIENTGGIADLFVKARNDQPLSEVEEVRLFAYSNELLDNLEWQHSEVLAGRLPLAEINMRAWRVTINGSAVRDALDRTRSDRDPVFLQFIEDNFLNR